MRYRERLAELLVVTAAILAIGGVAPAVSADSPEPGGDWPKAIRFGETKVALDVPHAESLEGTAMKARGTARVQRQADTEPSFATIWYEADVEIDRDLRTVRLVSVRVSKVQLPGAPPARQQRLAARLGQEVTRLQLRLPLDDVLAGVKMASRRDETSPKLGTEPPRILFETEPAVLVVFDGEPRFRAVEGSRLERALNTPFLVLSDPGAKAYYLNGGTSWFRSPDVKGPWTKADDVPPEAAEIARRDLKDAGVADKEVEEARGSADKRVPKILVATEPTELIVSDGPAKWSPEVEGELNAMSSTESDVFQTLPDQRYWIVLSGRWYRSDAMSGPWTFVDPDQLPESFRRIREDSAKAAVLAFVPGTGPAREGLEDSSTPRTAAIRRSEAHVSVTYDGDPRFETVPGTHVEYALNTPDQVLRIQGRYYAVDKGVWFSGSAPGGPWVVADAIPDDEIRAIPPDSPVYNTRFAYVVDATPDVVYVAYTPSYLGSYAYHGAVVFGTGWFYRPWWGAAYYPRPWTWGFHARYAPWAGWGYGFGWGPAWGGFRYGFGYGWGARWCGPGGFFRPAYRNVNITRNVSINRNVTVNRNLYASGVNRTPTTATRATTTGPTHTAAAGAAHAATTGTAHKATAGPKAVPKTAGTNSAKAGKAAHAPKSKAGGGGRAGARGGGKKER